MINRFKLIALVSVIFLTIAASASIYSTTINYQNIPFHYDPADNAWEGLRIAKDLLAGDIISFLGHTYMQGWRPFFHSWLLAPAFILFGNTPVVARTVSLFCLIIFILTLYLVCLEFCNKWGHWIGLIATYLALSSLPILVLSNMCMREIPGLLMTFITFLFYLKAIKQQRSSFFICTSFFMTLTFFTKWHHGVFVILAIFLTQLTTNKKILSKSNYCLFVPLSALMTVWFIHPLHIYLFYKHSTFQPHFYNLFNLDNLLYYPKSFFQVYHSSLLISIPLAISFVYSLKGVKDSKTRLFAIHFLVGIIFMTIKLDNRHRYIISIVPSIWLLGASQFVVALYYVKNRINNKNMKIILASALLISFLLISLVSIPKVYKKYPKSLQKYNYYSDDRPNKVYEFIFKNVINHNYIVVFNGEHNFNFIQSPTIRWFIEVSRKNNGIENKKKRQKANHYFYQLLKNRDNRSYQNLFQFLINQNVRVDGFHLLSFMKTLNKQAHIDYITHNNVSPFSKMLTKDVNSIDKHASCLITIYNEKEKEFNYFAEKFLTQQDEWKEFKRKKFVDLGITITMYDRKIASCLT